MTSARDFSTERTLRLLQRTAVQKRLIAYKQVSRHYGIADQDWAFIGALLLRHLDNLLAECHRKNELLFPLLAVPYKARISGHYAPRRLRKIAALLDMQTADTLTLCHYIARARGACFRWGQNQIIAPLPPYAPQPPRQYGAVR